MYTVKGLVKNGVVMLDEPVKDREGERVLITFLADVEQKAFPTLETVVAKIIAQGPNPDSYMPPTASLADLLANAPTAEPIDSDQWDRQWTVIEAQLKARDLADDRAEGRL